MSFRVSGEMEVNDASTSALETITEEGYKLILQLSAVSSAQDNNVEEVHKMKSQSSSKSVTLSTAQDNNVEEVDKMTSQSSSKSVAVSTAQDNNVEELDKLKSLLSSMSVTLSTAVNVPPIFKHAPSTLKVNGLWSFKENPNCSVYKEVKKTVLEGLTVDIEIMFTLDIPSIINKYHEVKRKGKTSSHFMRDTKNVLYALNVDQVESFLQEIVDAWNSQGSGTSGEVYLRWNTMKADDDLRIRNGSSIYHVDNGLKAIVIGSALTEVPHKTNKYRSNKWHTSLSVSLDHFQPKFVVYYYYEGWRFKSDEEVRAWNVERDKAYADHITYGYDSDNPNPWDSYSCDESD